MLDSSDLIAIWKDLAALIETLPEDQKQTYYAAIRQLVHDLRQDLDCLQCRGATAPQRASHRR